MVDQPTSHNFDTHTIEAYLEAILGTNTAEGVDLCQSKQTYWVRLLSSEYPISAVPAVRTVENVAARIVNAFYAKQRTEFDNVC